MDRYNQSRSLATGFILSGSKFYYLLLYSVIKDKKKHAAALASFISDLKEQSDNYFNANCQFPGNPDENLSFCLKLLVQIRMIIQQTENIFKLVNDYLNNELDSAPDLLNKEFKTLNDSMSFYFNYAVHMLKSNKFDDYNELVSKEKFLFEMIGKLQKHQFKMSKREEISVNQCIFSINLMEQSKMLLQNTGILISEVKQFAGQNIKEEEIAE